MTALYIIGAIVLLIILFLIQFAGIIIKYREEATITVILGPIRYTPAKHKKKPKKAKKKKKEIKEDKEETEEAGEKKKEKMPREAIFELISAVKEILPKFFGKVHFKFARLRVKVATGDPASTALACGGAKIGASLLFETVDNLAVLDRGSTKDVAIEPDFVSGETQIDALLRFRVRVFYILKYGIKLLIKFIKIKIKNER